MSLVLVVDDDEKSVHHLEALLLAAGFQVECASDGIEALDKAHRHKPAAVISDLVMPGMDGYTLLREWKADLALKAVPFVIYKGKCRDAEDEDLVMTLGADLFLLRPARGDELVAGLGRVLDPTWVIRAPGNEPGSAGETALLRQRNSALIDTLEQKSVALAAANRELERNLGERMGIEASLRESEERFRQLAESIDDVVWLSDLRNNILYVSPNYDASA